MKFNLPENETLPVQFLSSTFNNTSATYKYYWFLSIIGGRGVKNWEK